MHMKFDDVLCLDDINLQYGVTDGDINCLNKLKVPLPKQEHDRIRTLREAKLFDTKPEEDYDRFTTLAARALKVSTFPPISSNQILAFHKYFNRSLLL